MTSEPQDIEAVRAYWASYQKLEQEGLVVGGHRVRMEVPEIGVDHWPALGMDPAVDQFRADAAFGAAWRRCEAKVPEGWRMGGLIQRGARDEQWQAIVMQGREGQSVRVGTSTVSEVSTIEGPKGPTPTAALLQLAEKLEGLPR